MKFREIADADVPELFAVRVNSRIFVREEGVREEVKEK